LQQIFKITYFREKKIKGMKRFFYTLLLVEFTMLGHAQIGRFLGGGGFLLFNDYINQKQRSTVDLSYGGALSFNALLGINALYLDNDQSISFSVDPLYSVLNIKSESVNQHFALPLMAKYNWGFLSNTNTLQKVGLSFGAGLSKHWLIAEDTYASKWQPTIALAFRAKMPTFRLNLFKAPNRGERLSKSYSSMEIVLYHGFEQEIIEIESITPNTFTWTALCLRFYLNEESFKNPVKVGF
jgi:hypothetical protein